MTDHDRFFPSRAELSPGLQPDDSEFHDVLVIPPKRRDGGTVIPDGQFYRFPVVKVDPPGSGTSRAGKYGARPELWDRSDMAQRKIAGIASPEGEGTRLGPAFAVVPIKPEPGSSSCGWCYLVNAKNLISKNAWTAEEWSAPGAPDLEGAETANAKELEVLLALSRGIVVRFRASNLDALDPFPGAVEPASVTKHGVTYEIEPVRLNNESDIWTQLRNGSIAGRARYHQGKRIVPLVNVTSLMDPSDREAKS